MSRDDTAGRLTLSTPYYSVRHDFARGGAITHLRLLHGKASNLLVRPIGTRVQNERGARFSDLRDAAARVSHRHDGTKETVTVQSRLLDEQGRPSEIQVTTVYEYHWGYIKIRKEFASSGTNGVMEVCPLETVLSSSLSQYGYREGLTEDEGAPPFSFGSNRWGKLRHDGPSDPPLGIVHMPRSMLVANPGVEGLEWFAGSDLAQWDLQIAGRRGQGQVRLEPNPAPPGLALSIAPFWSTNAAVTLPKVCTFDYYLGVPLLEGHALTPWFHTSFNRNQGSWVAPAEIERWKETGMQTVHCHNDGDYFDDGLFWRDGSYPPYPDMGRFDGVVTNCQRAGIRVATYFSNKELHPSTVEFQTHGQEWGRMNRAGKLQHNFYKGTNEFGVQMCLRSGWLDFLKFSIDRVLTRHGLNGVYYDWNVSLYCCNPSHEGKKPDQIAAGHWDIDELLDLMEWTRRRVGPDGLVILHNTTTPMFTLENFADDVVANEWGYGSWKGDGPKLNDLPLEWSLVNARRRGVISYGQLTADSPKRLHRLFALQALLSGVTPWPASPDTMDVFPILKSLGNLEDYRFADWRNEAISFDSDRCASAIYSRPLESYILLANLSKESQSARCVVRPDRLPFPLPNVAVAKVLAVTSSPGSASRSPQDLDPKRLLKEGVDLALPPDQVLLLQLR